MSTNRYAPPSSEVTDPANTELEYAGFWIRTGAALIDAVLIIAITYPILYAIYGSGYFDENKEDFIAGPADFLISYVAPAILSILFWLRKQGTPGKLALSLRVVDAQTGNTLSVGQSIGRYLAYFVSMIPLGLGIIWVGIDARKQGWHDKLAKTVVVRAKASTASPVVFDRKA
jgi:uncharacterized RDD family membrane protein YckC